MADEEVIDVESPFLQRAGEKLYSYKFPTKASIVSMEDGTSVQDSLSSAREALEGVEETLGDVTAEQLASTIADSHSHGNKDDVLDLLGVDEDGGLTFDGEAVGGGGGDTASRPWTAYGDGVDEAPERLRDSGIYVSDEAKAPEETAQAAVLRQKRSDDLVPIYPQTAAELVSVAVEGVEATSVAGAISEVLDVANAASSDAANAQSAAEAAQSTADAAQASADKAASDAATAQSAAESAQATADEALEKAEAAGTAAENAQSTAEAAQEAAEQASSDAATAQSAAEAAQATANEALTKAEAGGGEAGEVAQDVAELKEEVTEITNNVTTLTTDVTNLTATVEAQEATISSLSETVEAQTATIANLTEQLAALQSALDAIDLSQYMKRANDQFTGGYFGTTVTVGDDSVIDLSKGNVFLLSETNSWQSGTLPLTITGAVGAACFTLFVEAGTGMSSREVFPANVKWSEGEDPLLEGTGGFVFTFVTYNGGEDWYGTVNSINPAVPEE